MADESHEAEKLADLLGQTSGNLEALLGLLLLARRLRVEKVSHAGSGKANLEITGDGIGPALEVLGQLLGLAGGASQTRRVQTRSDRGSFWRALRDFVLPPEA